MIAAAIRASDHKRLRPWRFIVVRGEALATLGNIFSSALKHDDPDASAECLADAGAKAQRAPVLVVSVVRIDENERVPEVEQLLSAGGATQMLLLACSALGYAGIWRTGSMAYHALVKKQLKLDDAEQIVGFVYMGRAVSEKPLARMEPQDFRSDLTASGELIRAGTA